MQNQVTALTLAQFHPENDDISQLLLKYSSTSTDGTLTKNTSTDNTSTESVSTENTSTENTSTEQEEIMVTKLLQALIIIGFAVEKCDIKFGSSVFTCGHIPRVRVWPQSLALFCGHAYPCKILYFFFGRQLFIDISGEYDCFCGFS